MSVKGQIHWKDIPLDPTNIKCTLNKSKRIGPREK
jgi:hypothetical protein